MLLQVFPRILLMKGSRNCTQFVTDARSLPFQASPHLHSTNFADQHDDKELNMCSATVPTSTAIKISCLWISVTSIQLKWITTRMLNKGYLILYFGGGGGISNLNHIMILNKLHSILLANKTLITQLMPQYKKCISVKKLVNISHNKESVLCIEILCNMLHKANIAWSVLFPNIHFYGTSKRSVSHLFSLKKYLLSVTKPGKICSSEFIGFSLTLLNTLEAS